MVYKYRLTTLLSLTGLVAVLLTIYLRLWPVSPLLAAVATSTIVSVFAIYYDFTRNGTGASGAFAGGLLGGLLAAIFHVASSYLLLPYFEDENLGFVGTLLIFTPFGIWVGFFVSIAIWGVMAAARWMARWKR